MKVKRFKAISLGWKAAAVLLGIVGLVLIAYVVRVWMAFAYDPGEMPRNREIEARLRPCDAGRDELLLCAAREGLYVKVFEPPLPDERSVIIALPDIHSSGMSAIIGRKRSFGSRFSPLLRGDWGTAARTPT